MQDLPLASFLDCRAASSIFYLLPRASARTAGVRSMYVTMHVSSVWAVNYLQIGLVNEACRCQDR